MKRKGFTLIELLAVIVVLAIIALIATPIVMNVIENTRKGAAERSASNLEHAAELYYYDRKLNEGFGGITFTCNEEGCKSGKEILTLSGKVPENGRIIINSDGTITLNSIVINGYSCYKSEESYTCNKAGTKTTLYANTGIITVDSDKTSQLSNYRIYGNSIENEYIEIVDLPTEYQQVDYIEGNGTQYFDTGIEPTNTTKAEVLFELTDRYYSQYILGSCKNASSTIIFGLNGSSGRTPFLSIFTGLNIEFGFRQRYSLYKNSLEVEYTEGSGYRGKSVYNDLNKNTSEIVYTDYSTDGITGDNPNIYLFAFNSSNIHKGMKVYNSKIWNNGVLVRNFIPCYRKNDGIPGLYDLVENKFYTSMGSENFIKGSNVEDVKIDHLGNYNNDKYEIPIRAAGKNLLNINRTESSFGEQQYNYSRKFEFNKFYVGFTSTNRSISARTSYRTEGNSIFVTSQNSGYGIAFPVRVESNTTYTVSSEGENNVISIGEYDAKGNHIGHVTTKTFTTTENTKIITIVLSPDILTTEVEYKNIQLEKGTKATSYESYQEQISTAKLDEPLRCVDGVCDYIDFKTGKVVRNVEVKTDGSLLKLEKSISQDASLPTININKGINNIFVETNIEPSKIEIEYYK